MKRVLKSPKLLLAFTLLFLLSTALTMNSFANDSPTPEAPILTQSEYLFIDSHIQKIGVGDVGPPMLIDFPTYSYSKETQSLQSYIQITGFGTGTKVIVGSGGSLGGTAGGGVSTVLKAYDNLSSDGLFSVDNDLTVHFYMHGDWRTVAPGETWTEKIEEKSTLGSGTMVYTYTVTNYGKNLKSRLLQPIPVATPTSASPTPTPTQTAETKNYKVSGYIRPEPKLDFKSYCAGFKVEIPELGISSTTNESGYFLLDGVTEKLSGSYSLKVSKTGYMTRVISNLNVNKDIEVGSLEKPVSVLSGDVNGDGAINMSDVFELASIFNISDSSPNFVETADLNYDGVINMSDVMIIAVNFNKSSNAYTQTRTIITNINYINVKLNDYVDIVLEEGGFAGKTWKYAISDKNIIEFESYKHEFSGPSDGIFDDFVDSMWRFKAISTGTATILFTPSTGTQFEKYIVTVTGNVIPTATDASSSPVPTVSPKKDPPVVNSTDLKNTLISTDYEEMITSGKNIIYCPTFQMAWDNFKTIIGGDVMLSGKPPLADKLNAGFPMLDSLSPDSYVAMAGHSPEIVDKINNALISKFGDSAPKLDNPGIGFLSYAYLSKNLSFAKAFESIVAPFNFNSGTLSSNVKAFGINTNSKMASDLSKQIEIYDYKSKNDFIIKLIPAKNQDEIILAKVTPGENLYKTYSSVMSRIENGTRVGFEFKDSLKIPVLDFNIGHNYTELEGKSILNPGCLGYSIQKAYQRTRFKLDENGAELASEAIIYAPPSYSTPTPKELFFDGPFMIIMREKDAVNPYLMIWVDNPELLVK